MKQVAYLFNNNCKYNNTRIRQHERIRKLFLFFLIVPSFASSLNSKAFIYSNSKANSNSECIVQTLGHNIMDSMNCYRDSVYVQINETLSSPYSKVFDVFNTTSNSIYLYSGLFISDWMRQPYVHQYNILENTYVFSLTPLYKNFKIVFQHNSILDVHYNWYRFVELQPGQYYRLRTTILEEYLNVKQNAMTIINPKTASEALFSPFIDLKKQNIQSSSIRLGFYNKIDTLCEGKSFNGSQLTFLQMNFTVISAQFVFWGE